MTERVRRRWPRLLARPDWLCEDHSAGASCRLPIRSVERQDRVGTCTCPRFAIERVQAEWKRTRRASPTGPIRSMPQTTQCTKCGVILNLPPGIKPGKRLKCPRCSTKFTISESDASSASTVPGIADATAASVFDMQKRSNPPDDLPPSLGSGDLREAFDLPLVSGSAGTWSAQCRQSWCASRRRGGAFRRATGQTKTNGGRSAVTRGGGALPAAPACREGCQFARCVEPTRTPVCASVSKMIWRRPRRQPRRGRPCMSRSPAGW